MSLRFGTDGVRGVAGSRTDPRAGARPSGRAAARVLGVAAVSRDAARRSCSGATPDGRGRCCRPPCRPGWPPKGVDVVDLGVLPTPGVAAVAAARGLPAAVISASHNPYADNGIKLFAPGGRKLTDAQEAAWRPS